MTDIKKNSNTTNDTEDFISNSHGGHAVYPKSSYADRCNTKHSISNQHGENAVYPNSSDTDMCNTNDSIANQHGSHAYLEPVKTEWSIEELKIAHNFSIRNQSSVQNSVLCGCFYCLEIYSPTILTEADLRAENDGMKTYWCPHCGIDSVIGNQSGFPITPEFLTKMYTYYFW